MTSWTRTLVAAFLIGCCFTAAGCGDSADSPVDAYTAAMTALKDYDYRTYANHLTPNSLDAAVNGLLLKAQTTQSYYDLRNVPLSNADEAADEARRWEKVQPVLRRHNINLADLAPKGKHADYDVWHRAVIEQRNRVVDQIEDKPGFFHDMTTVYRRPEGEERAISAPESKLTDLTIDGATATANRRIIRDGKEIDSPVYFRQIDGVWKIEIRPERDDSPSGVP
jgi:hypothetical protein